MFFKAIAVKGGPGTDRSAIVLNSDVIMGIYQSNRILLSRPTLEEISKQIYNGANEISHIEVIPEVAQSLQDIK